MPVEVECSQCGEAFEKLPSQAERSDNHFCSNECQGKFKSERVVVECDYCGGEIEKTPSQVSERNFCNLECLHEWRSETSNGGLVGENHPDYIGEKEYTCENCDGRFTVKLGEEYRKKTCSDECAQELVSEKNDHLSEYWYGEDNPRWKGGKKNFYGSNWQEQRRKAIQRDNERCVDCGSVEDLHVHHIIPIKEFDEDYESANDLDNLVTLCRGCHNKWEKITPLKPQVA